MCGLALVLALALARWNEEGLLVWGEGGGWGRDGMGKGWEGEGMGRKEQGTIATCFIILTGAYAWGVSCCGDVGR